MASRTVSNGLNRIADSASHTAGYSATRFVQTLSIDDSAVAFAAADTALNTGGVVTNEFDQVLDATPTRTGQVVTHVCTIPTGSGDFTIKRIALHDDTAANVTTSSTTLVAGIDGQALTKTVDFTMAITVTLSYSNV